MTKIYDQHEAAFSRVSAYVIAKAGERVATIALKFPADGAGRLYAYVHWLGFPMVRGYAGGYGYDKRSAAVAAASRAMRGQKHDRDISVFDKAEALPGLMFAEPGSDADKFMAALGLASGSDWDRQLRDAGFDVLQAV